MYDLERERLAPQRSTGEQGPKPGGSLLPVLMVAGAVLTLAIGLIVFTGKAGVLILAALAAVLALPMLHYLAWGWWLSKAIERDRQKQDKREPDDR